MKNKGSDITLFHCPICERTNNFKPYGYQQRQNAMCPSCQSLERHRFLYCYLKKLDLLANDQVRLLHFAPESCFIHIFENLLHHNYFTVDLYNMNVKYNMDINNLQFDENIFDYILCNHVLEHIEDDLKALKELYRVLKKGGKAIITVPVFREKTYEDFSITTPEGRMKAFFHPEHVRIYGKDIIERMETAGFEVKIINPQDILTDEQIKNYSLLANVTQEIYCCQK